MNLNRLIEFCILWVKTIRFFIGPAGVCKFELSCTDFAILQLKEARLDYALVAIFLRLLSCSPASGLFKFK